MEEQSYTSTHPLGHTGPVTGSLYLYLFLYFIYWILSHAKTKQIKIYRLFISIMGDLEEGYRDAGDRLSKTEAVWEALCLMCLTALLISLYFD